MDFQDPDKVKGQLDGANKFFCKHGLEQTNEFKNFLPVTPNSEITKDIAEKAYNYVYKRIEQADYVLVDLSVPNHDYVGCFFEFAHAKKFNKKIIVCTGASLHGKRLAVIAHADYICQTMEQAIEFIKSCEKKLQNEPGNSDCFYCDIIAGKPDQRGIHNELLLETRNYIVIPDAHNMLDETVYTLTLPKRHVKSMRDLPPEQIEEQHQVENLLRSKIYDLTGKKIVTFEHGAIGVKTIDHAHTHNVGNDGFTRETEQEILDETKLDGYLYYRDMNGTAYQFPLPRDVGSQYMRAKLWKQAGGVGDFLKECNWKNPSPEMVKRFLKNEQFTIDVLKGAITDRDKAAVGL